MAQSKAKDIELKEKLTPQAFKTLLHQWVEALDNNADLEFVVRNQRCVLPAEAISEGKLQVEYEIDEGQYEVELKVKWY